MGMEGPYRMESSLFTEEMEEARDLLNGLPPLDASERFSRADEALAAVLVRTASRHHSQFLPNEDTQPAVQPRTEPSESVLQTWRTADCVCLDVGCECWAACLRPCGGLAVRAGGGWWGVYGRDQVSAHPSSDRGTRHHHQGGWSGPTG